MLRPFSEPTHVFGNASTATISVVTSLTSPNRTVALYKLLLTASAATNVTIQDTSGAALSQTIPLTGSKALVLDQLDDNDPWFITAAGLGVQLAQSGTANIGFDAYYLGSPMPVNVPPSGVHVPVLVPGAWNPADLTNTTLSNNNLTATVPGAAATSVRGNVGLSSGKYYFEYIVVGFNSVNYGLGLANSSVPLGSGINIAGTVGVTISGNVWTNGLATGPAIGSLATASALCVAVDIGAQLIWFRITPSGLWNNSGTANPATGAGGISISALGLPLFPFAGWGGGSPGEITTANFGASAFTGVVPSGFTAGWGVLQ